MYKILTLNNISVSGLERLPRDDYEIASEITHTDAILATGNQPRPLHLVDLHQAIIDSNSNPVTHASLNAPLLRHRIVVTEPLSRRPSNV